MKTKQIVASGLLTILLGGCAATSPAMYTSQDKAPSVVDVITIQQIKPIALKKEHFSIKYRAKNTKPSEDNYVNTRGSRIDLNKLPTVVIALPVEIRQNSNNAQKLDKTGAFKTEGYINKAEETVEKELIRAGFGVIDRSKFEAKLRTLRESSNGSSMGDAVLQAEVQILNEKFKNKEITALEKADELARLTKSVSRFRGDKELIDMSELIRAAQSKGVKADYILQLNTIEEYNGYITQLRIKGNKDVESYINSNDNISYGNSKDTIPFNFDTSVFQVVFSAKLFNVQSGKVVWSGSHELNSLDIEDIQASFSIVKKDVNSKKINDKINRLNNQINIVSKEALSSNKILQKLYKKASVKREYLDNNIQNLSENKLKNSITKNENIISKNNKKINKFNSISKNHSEVIEFNYEISDLYIEPNLNPSNELIDNRKLKIIKKHRSKLLNKTIRSLFKTIKVKN